MFFLSLLVWIYRVTLTDFRQLTCLIKAILISTNFPGDLMTSWQEDTLGYGAKRCIIEEGEREKKQKKQEKFTHHGILLINSHIAYHYQLIPSDNSFI